MLYRLSYFRKSSLNVRFHGLRENSTFQSKSPIVFAFGLLVGEDGFEPPKVKTSRFTVCPIWPLWYSPKIRLRTFEPMEGIEPTTPRLQITCSGQLSYIGNVFCFLLRGLFLKGIAKVDIIFNSPKLFGLFLRFFQIRSRKPSPALPW